MVINQIILANTSIAVIGVVFATVWAGTVNKQIALSDAKLAADVEKSDMKASVMHFARGTIVAHDELHATYQLPAISGSTDDEFGKIGSERYGLPKSPL